MAEIIIFQGGIDVINTFPGYVESHHLHKLLKHIIRKCYNGVQILVLHSMLQKKLFINPIVFNFIELSL